MALAGSAKGYASYHKDSEYHKTYLAPAMSSNRTWLDRGFSATYGGGISEGARTYRVFNGGWSSYLNKFNNGAWIAICLPSPQCFTGVEMKSSDGYFPATGEIYYSDDGETYIKCGSWEDTSNSKRATALLDEGTGAHKIWKIMSTGRSTAHPNSNADISEAKFFLEETVTEDSYLPKGAGGNFEGFVLLQGKGGLQQRKLQVFFTYKQDDKVNLWEGTDALITATTKAEVNYRPHQGLDIRKVNPEVSYRLHQGLDIRKLTPYYTEKYEDKVETFTIPYGIGGFMQAYITMRLNSLVGYLNDMSVKHIRGIAIENHYFPLKSIQTIKDVPIDNNNTEDV